MQGSKSFGIPSKDELKSLGITMTKLGIGAAGTYFLQWASGHDWGDYKLFAGLAIAAAADFLHKWVPDTRTQEQQAQGK